MSLQEGIGVLLTKLRKKFSSKTVDVYTLNRVYLMAVTEMIKAYTYNEAMRRLFEWGYIMGHSYLLRLSKEIEKFKFDEKTTKLIGRIAWYMFSGTDPEVKVETRDFYGKKSMILYVRDSDSPWDKGFTIGKKVAYYPAGAYEGAANTFLLLTTKGETVSFSRNTKSLSAGDEYTEITTIYVPKSARLEEIEKVYPGFFDDIITFEDSQRLYRNFISQD